MQHNTFKRVAIFAALATCGFAAQAADWSDTSIGYRSGTSYREPYNSDKISKDIFNLTHVSGYSYGKNFFNADMLLSDAKDSPAKDTHAQEVYVVYRNTLQLSKLTGKDFKSGPVRDYGLTLGFDFNTKSGDGYQSKKRMLVAGPTVEFDVPGFLDVSLLALKESNAPAGHPARYDYNIHPMLVAAFGIPFNVGPVPLSFEGFAEYIGAKGKDEFGGDTAPETNIDVQVMYDVSPHLGAKKNTFKVGLEYQYWKNKFGNDSAKDTTGGSFAKTSMVRVEYHF